MWYVRVCVGAQCGRRGGRGPPSVPLAPCPRACQPACSGSVRRHPPSHSPARSLIQEAGSAALGCLGPVGQLCPPGSACLGGSRGVRDLSAGTPSPGPALGWARGTGLASLGFSLLPPGPCPTGCPGPQLDASLPAAWPPVRVKSWAPIPAAGHCFPGAWRRPQRQGQLGAAAWAAEVALCCWP